MGEGTKGSSTHVTRALRRRRRTRSRRGCSRAGRAGCGGGLTLAILRSSTPAAAAAVAYPARSEWPESSSVGTPAAEARRRPIQSGRFASDRARRTGELSSGARFVLERDVQAHAVARHLAVLDRDVEAVSLGNTQAPQSLRGSLDRVAGSSLPRFATDTNQLGYAIDALSHPHAPSLDCLLVRDYCRSRHLLQVATPLLLKPRLGSAASEYRRSGSCRSFHLFDRSRLSSYPRQPDPAVFASLDGREAVMRVATQRVVRARPLTARGEVPARRWRSAHAP
jgi:hypothetical protein